jgi:NAD(P)-dependent dehydrogenase (short-subunit alcohol dehydrogenase family)
VDLGLAGKVALVTASSKGLGLGSALALSQEGARVVLCARDEAALNEAAAATLSNTARTGMLGDGPVGDPADFGKVVCFLCSDPARFISGTALQIDGATTTGLL